jgi:hypothetical protein
MRDFTKSMMSYSWAMSLFGVQQMLKLMTPSDKQRTHTAVNAFDNVTQAAEEEFSGVVKTAFTVGDNIQRGLVDLTFGILTLGGLDPSRMTRAMSDLGKQAAQGFDQSSTRESGASQATGWGPVPQPDESGERSRRS